MFEPLKVQVKVKSMTDEHYCDQGKSCVSLWLRKTREPPPDLLLVHKSKLPFCLLNFSSDTQEEFSPLLGNQMHLFFIFYFFCKTHKKRNVQIQHVFLWPRYYPVVMPAIWSLSQKTPSIARKRTVSESVTLTDFTNDEWQSSHLPGMLLGEHLPHWKNMDKKHSFSCWQSW